MRPAPLPPSSNGYTSGAFSRIDLFFFGVIAVVALAGGIWFIIFATDDLKKERSQFSHCDKVCAPHEGHPYFGRCKCDLRTEVRE